MHGKQTCLDTGVNNLAYVMAWQGGVLARVLGDRRMDFCKYSTPPLFLPSIPFRRSFVHN